MKICRTHDAPAEQGSGPSDPAWTPLPDPGGPLRFERRRSDRWSIEGVAEVFELAGEGFGRTHRLRLHDRSDIGMGGITDTVIAPGTVISVSFNTPGNPPRRGVVTRCLPCGQGYRIAVSLELRLAA